MNEKPSVKQPGTDRKICPETDTTMIVLIYGGNGFVRSGALCRTLS